MHAWRRAYVRKHRPARGDQDYEAMAKEMMEFGLFSGNMGLKDVMISIQAHVIQVEAEDEATKKLHLLAKRMSWAELMAAEKAGFITCA